tara:strand:+ start:369 stop:740 length:372 start_codon:yes stop_codon:yes gene_type:complete
MNANDLELKISGLEKVIQENKADADRYQDELKQTQQTLEDYNKPELTPMMMDEVNDAIDKAIREFDFTDADNYDVDFEIDYDNKISISSIELNTSDELQQEIIDAICNLFKEADAPEDETLNE